MIHEDPRLPRMVWITLDNLGPSESGIVQDHLGRSRTTQDNLDLG